MAAWTPPALDTEVAWTPPPVDSEVPWTPPPLNSERGVIPAAKDFLKRIPEGMATGAGRTLRGMATAREVIAPTRLGFEEYTQAQVNRLNQQAFPNGVDTKTTLLTARDVPPDMMAQWRKDYSAKYGFPEERAQGTTLYQFGAGTEEAAREYYNTDRARDGEFIAQLGSAGGEFVPTVVAGALGGPVGAGLQYGFSAGQAGADEAIAAGRPDTATLAYMAHAGLGATTEALLGVPGRVLKMADRFRKMGIAPDRFRQALLTGAEGAVREGAQEGLEQYGGNLVARDLYDPNRRPLDNVGRSMALGATLGFIVGAGGGAMGRQGEGVTRGQGDGQPEVYREPGETVVLPESPPSNLDPLTSEPAPLGGLFAAPPQESGAGSQESGAESRIPNPESRIPDRNVVPDSPAQVAAQLKATADPQNPKAATLIVNAEGGAQNAELPDAEFDIRRLVPLQTSRGTVVVNPAKADPEATAAAIERGEGGRALGYSQETKPVLPVTGGQGDKVTSPLEPPPSNLPVIVQGRDAAGVPVTEEVALPEQVPAAVAAAQQQGGSVTIVTPEAALEERRAGDKVMGGQGDKVMGKAYGVQLAEALQLSGQLWPEVPTKLPKGFDKLGSAPAFTRIAALVNGFYGGQQNTLTPIPGQPGLFQITTPNGRVLETVVQQTQRGFYFGKPPSPAQTITGSNVQTGTEMPVPPQAAAGSVGAQAAAGAGEVALPEQVPAAVAAAQAQGGSVTIVTPEAALEERRAAILLKASPAQTITGSNVQTGTEMPVPPTTAAPAVAGAGEVVVATLVLPDGRRYSTDTTLAEARKAQAEAAAEPHRYGNVEIRPRVETPAQAVEKVDEHLENVAEAAPTPAAAKRSEKEIKSELVERLEAAIEAAPAEAEMPNAVAAKHVGRLKQRLLASNDAAALREIKAEGESIYQHWRPHGTGSWLDDYFEGWLERNGAERVTIEIPGDGTFTIVNSKEALGQVLRRANRLTTTPHKHPGLKPLPKLTPEELDAMRVKDPGVVDQVISSLEAANREAVKKISGGIGGISNALMIAARRIAITALKAGKSIAEAIEAALAHIRANHSGPVDEPAVRAELAAQIAAEPSPSPLPSPAGRGGQPEGQRERKGFPRVQEAVVLSPELREQITNQYYNPAARDTSAAVAANIVAEIGIEDSMALALDPTRAAEAGLSGGVFGALHAQNLRVGGQQERVARAAGDIERADALARLVADYTNRHLSQQTFGGQATNALKDISLLTPEGAVQLARRIIEDATTAKLGEFRAVLEQAREAMSRATRPVLHLVLNSDAIQRAAGEALTESVLASEALRKVITADVLAKITGNAEVRAAVEKALAKTIADATGQSATGGYWGAIATKAARSVEKAVAGALAPPTEKATGTVDEFGAEIAAVLREQLESALPPAQESTGRKRSYLERLATLLKNGERVEQVWKETQQRLAAMDDPRAKALTGQSVQEWSEKLLGRVVREQLREMGVRLGDLAKQPDGNAAFGTVLVQKIVTELGVDEATAKRIEAALSKAYVDGVAEARAKAAKSAAEAQKRALERQKQLAQSRGVWSRTKQQVAQSLAGIMAAPATEATSPLQQFAKTLAGNLRRQLGALAPEQAAVAKQDDMAVIVEGLRNAEKYEEAWLQTQHELRQRNINDLDALARIETFFRDVTPVPFNESALDRVIRQQVSEAQVRLAQSARQDLDAIRGRIGDAIVENAGLTGAAADTLRQRINERFERMATEAKRKAVEALLKPKVDAPRKLKSSILWQKLIELHNTGALDDAKYYDAVREALGLKSLTDAEAKELRALGEELNAIPADQEYRRARIAEKIALRIAKLRPYATLDLMGSMAVLGMLSSPATWKLILLANILKSGAEGIVQIALNPRAAPTAIAAAFGSVPGTVLEIAEFARTGTLPVRRQGIVYSASAIEGIKGWMGVPYKTVRRIMLSSDLLLALPMMRLREAIAVHHLLRNQKDGPRGQALRDAVWDAVHGTKARRAEALRQATVEGYSGLARLVRADEIIQRGVPKPAAALGLEMAEQISQTSPPYGIAGSIADVLGRVKDTFERNNQPVAAWAAHIMVGLFSRVAANVVNDGINYTPGGALRAGWMETLRLTGREYTYLGRRATRLDAAEMVARAAIGTLLWAAAMAWWWPRPDDDDENPPEDRVRIHGRGPRDAGLRETLKASGWIPNSFQVGKKFYAFEAWTGAAGLSWLANLADRERYKDWAGDTDEMKYVAAAWDARDTMLDRGMLSGLSSVLGSGQNPSEKMLQGLARTATSPVNPAIFRWVDRWQDPVQRAPVGVKEHLLAAVPFIRRDAAPLLGWDGRPVAIPARFSSELKPDPLAQWAVRRNVNLWPSPRDPQVGPYVLDPAVRNTFTEARGKELRRYLEQSVNGKPRWQVIDEAQSQDEAYRARKAEWEARNPGSTLAEDYRERAPQMLGAAFERANMAGKRAAFVRPAERAPSR